MKQSILSKLTKPAAAIITVILVLVPFHAFLTVWASSNFGHYTAWRLWDEVLLMVVMVLAIVLCFWCGAWKSIRQLHVFWLIMAYAALELTIGLVAYLKHD